MVGLLNCGVLVTLKDSPRISILIFSVKLKILKMERSALKKPGPERVFRPELPKRTPVG